ncbi:MAG: hypothetical protein NUV73_00160 [Candidatus Daviesbacteria bacterium]|nr:hypothetical protein [Candidatus Daviesbacteria bacterium]
MIKRDNSIIPIGNWNMGGLADSKFSGIKDSFYKLVGLNMHSKPGVITVAQKLTKDSGSTVTEFCKAGISATNGIRYWFSADSGKIWQDKAGTYTLVYTASAGAGESKCLGAMEYQGYLYWATQSRLHRIATANADGAAAWTANIALNWATFTITDILFHPMVIQNQVLYIGDANYLAQVDSGVFTANALDIESPLRIKALGKIGTDVLLGTYIADTITSCQIIRWNTWSVSFTVSDDIPEAGINAFIPGDNMVLVQAGFAGNIYFYNGTQLELYRKIPGDYTPTAYGYVHPQAVANFQGEMLIGFSNGSGDPALEGVYRIAKNSRNYPLITDFPYPISQRSTGALVVTGVEIGVVLACGTNLYVAWKNGTSYGIDKLDWSNKMEAAYLETRIMTVRREEYFNISKFLVAYDSLPTSTDVTIQYAKNYGSYTATTEVTDTDRKIIYADSEGLEVNTLQLKLLFTVSSNNAPSLESAGVLLR